MAPGIEAAILVEPRGSVIFGATSRLYLLCCRLFLSNQLLDGFIAGHGFFGELGCFLIAYTAQRRNDADAGVHHGPAAIAVGSDTNDAFFPKYFYHPVRISTDWIC